VWSTPLLLAALASLRVGVDAGPETPALVALLQLELPGVETGTTSVDRDLWVELRGDALVLAQRGGPPARRALDRLLDPAARRRVVALIVTEAAVELGYVRAPPAPRVEPAPAPPDLAPSEARARPPDEAVARPPDAPVPRPPNDAVPRAPDAPVPRPPDEAVPRPPDSAVPRAPDEALARPPDAAVPRAPDEALARPPDAAVLSSSPWALGVLAGVEVATGVGAPLPILRARLARTDLVVEPYAVLVVAGLGCCLVAQPAVEARTATSLLGVGVEVGLVDIGPLEVRWATEVVAGASWVAARALSYADRAPVELSVEVAFAVLSGPLLRWPLGPDLALDLTGGVELWARRSAVAVPEGYVGADRPLDPGLVSPFAQVGIKVGL
jgi:hypothetical protein